MAKYGKKASEKVEKAMHERKRGTLRSGRSGKKVKSRKQAIAIGPERSPARGRESAAQAQGWPQAQSRRAQEVNSWVCD